MVWGAQTCSYTFCTSYPLPVAFLHVAITSVSIHLADHHLTQLPAQSLESSAAGQHHPGIASRIPLDKLNEDRARRHPGKAEPGDNPRLSVFGLPAEQTDIPV
ncbi:hypothetical protein ACSBR1_018910 [Camellia fascicularis]